MLLRFMATLHEKRWKNWLHHHIRGMLGSYIGAVTALLVNIGIHIPIINLLPAIWFWFYLH